MKRQKRKKIFLGNFVLQNEPFEKVDQPNGTVLNETTTVLTTRPKPTPEIEVALSNSIIVLPFFLNSVLLLV